jgi:imidazolonepropionase-like amidohydrolase
MTLRLSILAWSLLLAGCKPPEETRLTAIIGAVLIDGSGGPPISRSVLVVAGSRVRIIGEQAATPVPAGAEKVNGAGKFLIAAPVEIPDSLPRVSTLEEAAKRIDEGNTALSGIMLDIEQLSESLLNRWRDLQVVFVPGLHRLRGEELARAQRNARRLSSAGVLIAAGGGAHAEQEWALLEKAGLTPAEIVAAATRNAARAANKAADAGTLEPGMTANLWLLNANPLETAANLRAANAERIMTAGQWSR